VSAKRGTGPCVAPLIGTKMRWKMGRGKEMRDLAEEEVGLVICGWVLVRRFVGTSRGPELKIGR